VADQLVVKCGEAEAGALAVAIAPEQDRRNFLALVKSVAWPPLQWCVSFTSPPIRRCGWIAAPVAASVSAGALPIATHSKNMHLINHAPMV